MTTPFSVFGWRDDKERHSVLFTPWTLVHIACGILAASIARAGMVVDVRFGAGLLLWTVVHATYEFKDVYRSYFAPGKPGRDSLSNSLADQAVAMVAFAVAWKLDVNIAYAMGVVTALLVVLVSPLTSATGDRTTLADSWNSRG